MPSKVNHLAAGFSTFVTFIGLNSRMNDFMLSEGLAFPEFFATLLEVIGFFPHMRSLMCNEMELQLKDFPNSAFMWFCSRLCLLVFTKG